jgi:CheY-like chemotaxis protein
MQDNHCILLVDDDEFTRHYLREVLASEHYRFLEAANGAEALGVIANTRPDLILMDLLMPLMGGLEVLAELQEHAAKPPVLIISSLSTEGLVDEAMRAGAVGFISKPFGRARVRREVEVALQG